MMEQQDLAVIGLPDSQDTIRRVFSDLTPSKVLDVPCGTGAFAKILNESGWDVHCADIDEGNLLYTQTPFTPVNLNHPLPFEDGQFDVVSCVNGLHRVYNVSGAISEFYRILKPGGFLYINVNNYASIKSRVRFLFLGSVDAGLNDGQMQQTTDNPEANFRQCLLLPQIANALVRNGFEIVNSYAAAVTWKHKALWPLSLIIKLLNCLIPSSRKKGQFVDITASNAMNPGGDYLLIQAKK